MTWKLGFVKTLLGTQWTVQHDNEVKCADEQSLVVCAYVKTRIHAYQCLNVMASKEFVINNDTTMSVRHHFR